MQDLPIAKPPWTKIGKDIEKRVRKAVFENDLCQETKIAIALSGGKDSLLLLFMLHAISGKGLPPMELTAIHIEGETSCGANIDKSLLQSICKKLHVHFICRKMPKLPSDYNCYICSRIRRKLLFATAKEHHISTIAFGHHRDDCIQTLLMNLLHKGEFAGMLAKVPMYRYETTIIRPLLYVAEKDIITFAEKYAFKRVTCQCIKAPFSKRSEIEKYIKLLEATYPHIRSNLFLANCNYGSSKAIKMDKIVIKKCLSSLN